MTLLTDIKSSVISAAGAGLTVYATKEDLPTSGLTSGDQAYVTANSRLYVSNGSGWYNVALINATPSLTISPSGAIELSTLGATTTITLTATDSDNAVAGLTFSVDSDGNFGGMASISQDSSVFTITPLSVDSATTSVSTLTFKASDGISFGSGTRTLNLDFAVQYSSYTAALQQADVSETDTQVDASGNSYTLTGNGGITSRGWTPYHPGGYCYSYAGGDADYFEISSPSSALSFGTGDFCMEMWIWQKPTADGVILADQRPTSTNGSYIGTWAVGGDGALGLDINASQVIVSNPGVVIESQWNHIVVNRSGTTMSLFANGSRVAQVTNSTNLSAGAHRLFKNAFSAGGIQDGAGGFIKDYRVVKGDSVYGTGTTYTVPTETLTAISGTAFLMFTTSNTATEVVGTESITFTGSATAARLGPFDYVKYTKAEHGGSVYFDGANDYITTNSTDTAGTGDFTAEAWVWWNSTANTWQSIITQRSSASGGAAEWSMGINTTGYVYWYNGAHYSNSVAGLIKTGQWNHIAIVRESGTVHGYVNGVKFANQASGTNTNNLTYQNITIGANNDGSEKIAAFISDARVVYGTAVYSGASFTPPTAKLPAISGTSILTCTNKANMWDTAQGRAHVKNGNATISNTQRKFTAGSSIYLDGSGDYITHTLQNGIHPNFTVEGWFYSTNSSNRGRFSIGTSGTGLATSSGSIAVAADGSGFQMYYAGGETGFGGGTQSLNTWQHYALVRNGSTITLYVDGSAVRSATQSGDLSAYRFVCIGGYYSTSYLFQGYIQDFRITQGLARYTGNFTPPTTDFDG